MSVIPRRFLSWLAASSAPAPAPVSGPECLARYQLTIGTRMTVSYIREHKHALPHQCNASPACLPPTYRLVSLSSLQGVHIDTLNQQLYCSVTRRHATQQIVPRICYFRGTFTSFRTRQSTTAHILLPNNCVNAQRMLTYSLHNYRFEEQAAMIHYHTTVLLLHTNCTDVSQHTLKYIQLLQPSSCTALIFRALTWFPLHTCR